MVGIKDMILGNILSWVRILFLRGEKESVMVGWSYDAKSIAIA